MNTLCRASTEPSNSRNTSVFWNTTYLLSAVRQNSCHSNSALPVETQIRNDLVRLIILNLLDLYLYWLAFDNANDRWRYS